MNDKYTVTALRELIAVRLDSEQALRMCANSVASRPLRELCERAAAECAAAVRELEALVARLAGERQAPAAVAGSWRSGWAGLRATTIALFSMRASAGRAGSWRRTATRWTITFRIPCTTPCFANSRP